MADVLIVCVREDELQAKALADMFERAGFSVGGAPANDGALRSTGAGVIVWSQASIRSRPFLDAAQRVIDAEKAVIASLIDPPPPHTINNAAAFALNGWTGDPEDQALDPLFFAVDRMVSSQRAAVGAAPARPAPESFQEPPSLRPPPSYGRHRSDEPRSAPRSRAPEAPSRAENLGAETEHWRAIRDSRDPADFMDYLARYGASGAFAEVAEIKLKQLTGPNPQAPQPSSLRDAARSAAPSARNRRPEPPPAPVRMDPPPRRIDPPPPMRVETPPPRRAPDPPPPPRRDPPPAMRRESSYFDRPPLADTREAPRMGGIVRLLILVALLGGGVFAARYYFGDAFQSQQQAAESAPDMSPPSDLASNEPLGANDGVGGAALSEEPGQAQPSRAAPIRRDQTRQPPARQQQNTRASAQQPATQDDGPPPAPTTSWASGATTTSAPSQSQGGGPASLLAGSAQPSTQAPSQQQQPTILAANIPPVTAPPPATTTQRAAARPPAGVVQFVQRPTARRIAELYPSRAQRDGTGGRAELDCTVRADLGLTCGIANETPAGGGFGRAALVASGGYRARATLSDGTAAAGTRTRIAIVFQPPPQ